MGNDTALLLLQQELERDMKKTPKLQLQEFV